MMGYWKSQWISTDELKALTAIARIKDEGTLCRIACECGEARVAEVAVAGINDNQMLAALAADTNLDISVRKAAIHKLTDQTALCKAALYDGNDIIAREAISRLSDPEDLRQVIRMRGSPSGRELQAHALKRLLAVAEPDTVRVDEELLEWLLEDKNLFEYAVCIKALYLHTSLYRERIAQRQGRYTINSYRNGRHADYGFCFDLNRL
jgi:hypothetical protein